VAVISADILRVVSNPSPPSNGNGAPKS